MMDELYAVLSIGVCIFLFLLVILALGSFYGGSWELIAQGVTPFILLIVGFSFGAYVLIKLLESR